MPRLPSGTESDPLVFDSPKVLFAFVLSEPTIPPNYFQGVTHVRILLTHLPPFQPTYDVHETYLKSVNVFLQFLPNLADLVLLWEGIPVRVFDGCDFELEGLTCTMKLDSFEGLKFLTKQNTLSLLELPFWNWGGGRASGGGVPPPDAFLPDLVEVSLPPKGLMEIVPGRPCRAVDIRLVGVRRGEWRRSAWRVPNPGSSSAAGRQGPGTLFRSDSSYTSTTDSSDDDELAAVLARGRNRRVSGSSELEEGVIQVEDHEWDPLMHALSRTKAPVAVEDLALATLDVFDPHVVLKSIARHLPSIKSLYLRIYTPEDPTQDILHCADWEPYLSHMHSLRTLRIEYDCQSLAASQGYVTSELSTVPFDPTSTSQTQTHTYTLPPSYGKGRSSSSSSALSYRAPHSSQTPARQRVEFNVPSRYCVDAWTSPECCPTLERLYVGVFGGDALMDWAR